MSHYLDTCFYRYQTPSVLKLTMDRLACADGGNPDLTMTSGKDPEKAKAIELEAWSHPKDLAGQVYGPGSTRRCCQN